MDLLPRTHQEFGSAEYWNTFFQKRGKEAFEWYGEYPELCGILHKYIKPADKTLMIGCGNSTLSADLYDVGYHNITNIDISDVVIRQMIGKNEEQRPDMKFIKMDMLQMDFEDGQFSVVLDKGTLDAVMTDDSEGVHETVNKMFAEVGRVLRVGGRYICITLAQEQILNKVLKHFPEEGWLVRACRMSNDKDESQSEFHMPVFIFVFTKFKKLPNMKKILEVSPFEDKVDRYESIDQLKSVLREMQQYGIIRQQLQKDSHVGESISLDLYSAASSSPRYTLHIVDTLATKKMAQKFAVFIVPEGRETEWIFSSIEGRQELGKTAGFQRLVVVTLHRSHLYDGLEGVKAELSGKVMELAPSNLGKQQVPFLTVGDDIKGRTVKFTGKSEFTGEYVVEDIDSEGQVYRRLVFMSNKNVVQSEAKLVKEIVKKKGGKKNRKLVLDTNYLSSKHHSVIIAGLSFLKGCKEKLESGLDLLLVGLGGGSLPNFIHHNFSQIRQEIVEIDPSMVNIAKEWFSFVEDDRSRVIVADGLEHVNKLSEQGEKKHVVIIDVDSKDSSIGMSCPPKPFVEKKFLSKVKSILHPDGVFILNLVCRDQQLRGSVVEDLKAVFSKMCSKKLESDVNEIIFCMPTPDTFLTMDKGDLSTEIKTALQTIDNTIETNCSRKGSDIVTITDKFNNLTIL